MVTEFIPRANFAGAPAMRHIGSLLALLLLLLPSTTQASNGAASCQVVLGPALTEAGNVTIVGTADCGNWNINDLATLHPGLGGLKVKGSPARSAPAKCGVQETGLVCLITFCTGVDVQLLIDVHDLNVLGVDGVLCVANSSHVWLMDGSNFSNNTVSHTDVLSSPGGSVLKINGKAKVVVTKTSFRGNVVHNGTVSVDDSSHLTVNGSEFQSNTAIVGGAMEISGHAVVKINAVHILNNSASQYGGGMLVHNNASLKLDGVTLSNNSAEDYGGGMAVGGNANVTLDAVHINNNSANYAGGIFIATNATVVMRACNITKNSAKYGGGVAVWDHANVTLDTVHISNNSADSGLGGGLIVASNTTILMRSCKVTDNWAGDSGGGMVVQDYSDAMLNAVVFTGNRAKGTGGGGMLVEGYANVALHAVTVLNNSGDTGGGLAVDGNTTATLVAVNITGNRAKIGGGGMMAQGCANISLGDVTVLNNSVDGYGGGLAAMNNTEISMRSCKVTDNLSGNQGGGMYVQDLATATLDAVNIAGNSASQYGGGMAMSGSASVRLSAVQMVNNSADYGGGLVAFNSATVKMKTCSATHNNATIEGGGILFMLYHTTARLESVNITGNSATSGGGISAENSSTVVMIACKVTENLAWVGGAAIHMQHSSRWMLDNVEVFNNHAGTEGGGILANNFNGYSDELFCYISIKNSLVQGNVAHSGAAMSFQGGNLTLGPNVTIRDNHAENEGGALLLIGGTTDIKGMVKIFNNTAGTMGAGIYWMLSNCDVFVPNYWLCPKHPQLEISSHAYITKNIAGLAGGGIFIGQNITTHTQATLGYGMSVRGNIAAMADADIYILTQDCEIGQSKKNGSDWCDKCPPGQYNIDRNDPKCQNCDDRSLCMGGAVIISRTGFWHTGGHCRLNETLRCPNNDACTHDVTKLAKLHPYSNGTAEAHMSQWEDYGNKQCDTGYQGVMCTVCHPKYGRTDGFSCEACLGVSSDNGQVKGQVSRAGVAAIIAIYFVAFTLYVLLTSLLSLYNGSYNSEEAFIDDSKSTPWWTCLEFNDVSKAFVTYLQYTIGIIIKLPIAWPGTLDAAFKALTKVWGLALGSAVSLDCLIPVDYDEVQAGVKAIISLCAPLATFTAVMMCHLLLWWGLAALLRFLRSRHLDVHNTAKVPATNGASRIQMVYQSRASRVSGLFHRCLGYLTAAMWQLANIYTIQWGWDHYFEAATTFAIVSSIISGFFWYPSIMRVFIGAFICITGCGEQRYWIMDTTKGCPWDKGGHHSLAWSLGFGLPAGVICLGTIVAVVTFLVHSQKKGYVHAEGGQCMQRSLMSRQRMFRMRYGYLYSDHKHAFLGVDGNHTPSHAYKNPSLIEQHHGCCGAFGSIFRRCGTGLGAPYLAWQGAKSYIYLCWDAVLHLQTLILVFISVYGQLLHVYYQVLILTFTFAAYLVLLMWLQPYHRGSQELQTISFCVMLATSFATLAFIEPVGVFGFSGQYDATGHYDAVGHYDAMKSGVTVVVVVINVGLIGLMVLLLLSLVFKDCSKWCRQIRGGHPAGGSSTTLDAAADPLKPACSIELT